MAAPLAPSDSPVPLGAPNLTVQQLEYLVAVDDHDTWSEAAASVGVTPSALSQGLAELERRVGIRLFERDGRRRVPTADHGPVLTFARQTLGGARDLGRWLAERRAGTQGEVRLGMIDAAATHHCRDRLRRHLARFPDLDIHLTVAPSGALLESLARATIQLAVCVAPSQPTGRFDLVPLADDPLDVLAPAGAEVGQPHAWGPWVTFPQGSHTRAVVADAVREVGARFDVVAESHQPEVLVEMVRLGLGWTVLPRAGTTSEEGITVVRRGLTARRLVLARRHGAAPSPAVDALATVLLGQD